MDKATTRKVDAGGFESESEHPKSTKKGAESKNTKEGDVSEEQGNNERDEDDNYEGSGEEYEVEAILEARHGSFPEGRTGYLIKWKGYDEKHNTWVDERDIQEATQESEAVASPAKKRGGQFTASANFQSELKQKEEDVSMKAPRTKKRGQHSKASSNPSLEELNQVEDEVTKKKSRKGSKTAKSACGKQAAARPADRNQSASTYVDMWEWKDVMSWEYLVECIDTVKPEGNTLIVYFTLKHNLGFARETAEVCKRKIPNLLIDFYQGNIHWKPSDENEIEE